MDVSSPIVTALKMMMPPIPKSNFGLAINWKTIFLDQLSASSVSGDMRWYVELRSLPICAKTSAFAALAFSASLISSRNSWSSAVSGSWAAGGLMLSADLLGCSLAVLAAPLASRIRSAPSPPSPCSAAGTLRVGSEAASSAGCSSLGARSVASMARRNDLNDSSPSAQPVLTTPSPRVLGDERYTCPSFPLNSTVSTCH
mmetsp:Transcript_99767/g.278713  ORF Transcript_99767/g.278713 Transcript_99767/m.278713 type:complete len:200 (-) Transcript_99767:99-698(-)